MNNNAPNTSKIDYIIYSVLKPYKYKDDAQLNKSSSWHQLSTETTKSSISISTYRILKFWARH